MSVVTVVYSSSRFDRSPESLHEATTTYIADHDPGLILGTEASRESRERALKHKDYGVLTGDVSGWDDCWLVYAIHQFEVIHQESYDMGGTGRYARIAVLKDRYDGKITVWAVPHFPAGGVEGELWRKQNTVDTRMWLKCVYGLRGRVNYLKRRYKAVAAFIGGDFNVDFKKAWVRALIKTIYPWWKNSWERFIASTHGNRLIDAILYKGKVWVVKAARRIKDDNSSDHKPFVVTFQY